MGFPMTGYRLASMDVRSDEERGATILGYGATKRSVGTVVRARRLALGMSQELLADLVGEKQTYISQIERGRIAVPRDYKTLFPLLADALKMPVAELFEAADLVVEVSVSNARVPLIGRIPADTTRFSLLREREDSTLPTVGVAAEDIQGARSPFALEVTGDCMAAIGIMEGDIVICDVPAGRLPRDGQLVVARVNGDEVALKRWCVTRQGVELRDGAGQVVYALADPSQVEILGLYLTYKPGPR